MFSYLVLVCSVFFILLFVLSLWYLGCDSFLRCRNSLYSYECGLLGDYNSRSFLSIRFFYFLVLFLVFDIELVLLIQSYICCLGGVSGFFICFLLVWFFCLVEYFWGFFIWL